jgi:chromosomal replication initiator protein
VAEGDVDIPRIWATTLGTLQVQTTRNEFVTWLRPARLLAIENSIALVGVPSSFAKERIENRYIAAIRDQLSLHAGEPIDVRVVIIEQRALPGEMMIPAESVRTEPAAEAAPASDSIAVTVQQLSFTGGAQGMLNPRYTFDRFIVGSSNRLANAACLAVAEHPAQAYNPLFLYGGVGLGKTHLLHAIGNRAIDRDPDINVLYVSSERFTNDLINAIRRQQTEDFRHRYRNIDILMIDDIQFIAGKDGTQEEFFHTFNTLHSAGKQIVISSDRPPKAIVTLEERLRSRFEWGLIVDVQLPDFETRTAILRAKSEQIAAHVPADVIDFLASRVQSNIRELEGCLNRVAAVAQLSERAITVEVAAAALVEILNTAGQRRISPDVIIREVAAHYGVELRALQGRSRSQSVVLPRQVAMYLLREETGLSLVDIGQLLGGRDHTTVIHGFDKVTEELNGDARLRRDIATIRERLYQGQDRAAH